MLNVGKFRKAGRCFQAMRGPLRSQTPWAPNVDTFLHWIYEVLATMVKTDNNMKFYLSILFKVGNSIYQNAL